MKRRMLPLGIAGLLAATVVATPGFAETAQELQRQIDALTKKEAELKNSIQQNEAQQQNLVNEREKIKNEVAQLMDEIDAISRQIAEKQAEIAKISEALEIKKQEKAAAEQRVAERDDLLKKRVRTMYTNGVVTYLDVLMSATSFSDFLDRMETLNTIVKQDKEILERNKRDRDLIAAKEREIQADLDRQQRALAEQKAAKAELDRKEKEKEVRILSLDRDIQRIGHMTEEQEEAVRRLAAQKSALVRKKREMENKEVDFYKGGALGWPLPGYTPKNITSPFGYRSDPFNKSSYHKGIDIGAPGGSNIVAAEKGVVVVAEWVNGYGNTVVIDHGNGLRTLYGHARKLVVEEGQVVERGQKVAEVGSTGRSTGNHLHFEVHQNGNPVNPMNFLK